jgi:hypothetical protein
MPRRRTLSATAAISFVLGAAVFLPVHAEAGRLSREVFTFADAYHGRFGCDGFKARFLGHDHGRVVTWFDAAGNPVRQEGHIRSVETDMNMSTGAVVEVRSRVNVHIDYVRDRQTITGIRNLSVGPHQVRIHSVGRLQMLASDPSRLISVHGRADDVNLGGGFCEALA